MKEQNENIISPVKDKRWWTLALCEVVALGIVVAYTCHNFTFRESVDIVVAFSIAYLVPRLVYTRSKISCSCGHMLLVIVGTLLACYTIFSMKMWTSSQSFSLEMPNLVSDDGSYYSWALSHYDGRCGAPNIAYKGVSLIMLAMWRLLGVSIVWPLALNYMLALLSIVITGKIAHRLLSHRFTATSPSTIAFAAMLMASLLCFLISQTVRIQKEACCSFGFVMVGYSLAGMSTLKLSKRERWLDVAAFVVGTAILALVRTNYVYFVVVGSAMKSLSNRGAHWKQGVLLTAFALVLTFAFNYAYNYTLEHQMVILGGGEAMARDFRIGQAQQPYLTLIGNYYFYPHWERLLLIPVTTGVQFIIPFPWLYDYSSSTVMSMLPRVRLMWYLVGGACIYYYLFITVVHHKRSNMGMWAWWPLACFMLMAYLTGGLVSRYALPLQPLFVVIALYVFLHVKEGKYRRSFLTWMAVYWLALIAVLIFSYHTQTEFLKQLHASIGN